MASSTYDRLKKIVAEELKVDESLVTPEASFKDALGADSLYLVQVIMALEDEFGIQIPDEEAEKITTVQDAVDYVDRHMSTPKNGGASVTNEAVTSVDERGAGK